MNVFVNRMIRAALLDAALYEEVEADEKAISQAMGAVVLASVAAGIGIGGFSIGDVLFTTIGALIGWVVWAALTYLIGTRVLPEPQTQADVGQLLRAIGFAASPGLVRIFGVVPGLMWISFTVAGIWMLVAMVVAVRQALDYQSTGRAVAVCGIGFIVQAVVFALLTVLIGVPTAAAAH
jgi:hypothetical protein